MKKQNRKLKKWIKKNWGKRCAGRCPLCALCQAWDAYDFLTLNEEEQPPCCVSPKGSKEPCSITVWEGEGGAIQADSC